MADCAGSSLSHSQSRDYSYSSDEEEAERRPRSVPPPAGTEIGEISPQKISLDNASPGAVKEITPTPRRPRGRPPGSKNKPKPPVFVTRESEPAMKPVVLEIGVKSDVIEMVTQFARKRHLGISILSAAGSVTNITLRHPGSQAPPLTLHGTFNILSLTGTFMSCSASSPSASPSPSFGISSGCFGISLAGSQGQVFGGTVAGKAVAATPVVVVGTTFAVPTFHRLPGEFGEADHQEGKGNGGVGVIEDYSGAGLSAAYAVASPSPLNYRIPPDQLLNWSPTSRPPPPY